MKHYKYNKINKNKTKKKQNNVKTLSNVEMLNEII
jgi:hypothetical protein